MRRTTSIIRRSTKIAALEAEALKLDGSISVQQAAVEEKNSATAAATRTLSNETVASALLLCAIDGS